MKVLALKLFTILLDRDFVDAFTYIDLIFYSLWNISVDGRQLAFEKQRKEGQAAVRFLEQYININGVPKTIRTDKATAFRGQLFREFCKNHQIKLIYGTPC